MYAIRSYYDGKIEGNDPDSKYIINYVDFYD